MSKEPTKKRTIEESEVFYSLRYGTPPSLETDAAGRARWFRGLEEEVLIGTRLGYREGTTNTILVNFTSVSEPNWAIFKRISEYYEREADKRRG